MTSRSQFLQSVDGPLSVADYIEVLNVSLGEQGEKIMGEVTEVKKPASGHVYFSLKDKGGEALIKCVMWRTTYRMIGLDLEDGMEIILGGAPNIYAKSGSLSFVAKTAELVGEGALKKQYELLKKKLTAEGIFADSRKRALPDYPQKIGVITSKSGGVVIYDYLSNLKKFGFISKIVDTRVEGAEAIKELYDSIRTMRKQDIDVLVVIRGGGSLESFAPFNNETLVREIASFPVPVIVGVGHHVDVCLAALAADVMVSTPTAAANLLNQSWEKAIYKVEIAEQSLFNTYARMLAEAQADIRRSSTVIRDSFNSIFERFRESEKVLMATLYKFEFSLKSLREELSEKAHVLFRSFGIELERNMEHLDRAWNHGISARFRQALVRAETSLEHSERSIAQGDPARQLRLGYSIVMSKGKVVRATDQVQRGERLEMRVSDGMIETEVTSITKEN